LNWSLRWWWWRSWGVQSALRKGYDLGKEVTSSAAASSSSGSGSWGWWRWRGGTGRFGGLGCRFGCMFDGWLRWWSLRCGRCLRSTSGHTTASFSGTKRLGINVIAEDGEYPIHALALAFLQHLTLTLSGLQFVAQWWLLLLAILLRLLILILLGRLRGGGCWMLLVLAGLWRTIIGSGRFRSGSGAGGSGATSGRTGTLGGSRFLG